MPAYNLKCEKCEKKVRKLLPKFEAFLCSCGGIFHRLDTSTVNTQIKEVLDNGVMVRKVERLHNIEEMVKEQSKAPAEDDFI